MCSNQSKTLKIFLIDGNPTGVKKVQLSNWSGLAFVIPRSRLEIINKREELTKQCLYFLLSSSFISPEVYIGEAESFQKRIGGHRDKDFWNICVVFLSKDENLSKAHVKFLEAAFISDCKNANRAKLHNANEPEGSKLSEEDSCEMLEFKGHIKIVLSALGYTFHESTGEKKDEAKIQYSIKAKGLQAQGLYTSEGFIVLVGSQISKEEVPSIPGYIHNMRAQEIKEGAIIDSGTHYEVVRNLTFDSVSASAAFVLGASANGWTAWKNAQGKTLDEIERKNTEQTV